MHDSMAEGFVEQHVTANAAGGPGPGAPDARHSDIPRDRGLEAVALADMASYAPKNPLGAPPLPAAAERTRTPWEGTGGGALARAALRHEQAQQRSLRAAAQRVAAQTNNLVSKMQAAAQRLKGLRKAALSDDPKSTLALAPRPAAATGFAHAEPAAPGRATAPDPGGLQPLRVGWLREGEREGRREGWRGGNDGRGHRRGYGERGRDWGFGRGWTRVSAALEDGAKTVQVLAPRPAPPRTAGARRAARGKVAPPPPGRLTRAGVARRSRRPWTGRRWTRRARRRSPRCYSSTDGRWAGLRANRRPGSATTHPSRRRRTATTRATRTRAGRAAPPRPCPPRSACVSAPRPPAPRAPRPAPRAPGPAPRAPRPAPRAPRPAPRAPRPAPRAPRPAPRAPRPAPRAPRPAPRAPRPAPRVRAARRGGAAEGRARRQSATRELREHTASIHPEGRAW